MAIYRFKCKNCKIIFHSKYKHRIFCANYCAQDFRRKSKRIIPDTFGKCSECLAQATSFFQCKVYCKTHYKLKKEEKDVKI